jgi:hypothetical protein
MSASPGRTLIPRVSMVGVPSGTATAERGPTAAIRSPAINTTPSSIGVPS